MHSGFRPIIKLSVEIYAVERPCEIGTSFAQGSVLLSALASSSMTRVPVLCNDIRI